MTQRFFKSLGLGLCLGVLLIALFAPKTLHAKPVWLFDYSATLPGGTPTHIASDPDGVLFVYSPDGGASTPKYLTRFPNPSTAQAIVWTPLNSNLYTDMVVTRNAIFATDSSTWVTKISLDGLTGTVSTSSPTNSGTSTIFMSSTGNLYSTRGSTYFAQFNPDSTPPSEVTRFAGLSLPPATRGATIGDDGTVYYLKGNPRNSVGFRAATGTGTSLAFTLPGTWGFSPLGGKLIRASPGGALYIAAAITSSPLTHTVYKMMPPGSGATATFISTYDVNSGTEGNISTLVSMALLPTGRIAVLTSGGTIQIYAPLPSVSGVSGTATSNGISLEWTSNIVDADFSGATIRRSTSGFPASVTEGTLVSENIMEASFFDTDVEDATTYYYTIFNRTLDGYYDDGVTVNAVAILVADDTTPPALVSELAAIAQGSTVNLTWGNPEDEDFHSVDIRRSTVSFPLTIDDGSFVVSGNADEAYLDVSLSDNIYYYSIFSRDDIGNYSVAATVSVRVDTTPPNAPTISSEKPTLSGSSIVLSWDATDDDNHFKLTRTFNDGDETVISANMISSSTGLTQTDLADGVYTYHLYLIDNFSNSSTAGTSNALTIDTLAPNAPTISAEKNAPDGSSIVLSWDATDDDNHFKLTRTFNDGDETVISANMVASSTGLTQTALADGVYTYHLYLIDNFSNSSTAGTSNALTIDTVAPNAPEISAEKNAPDGATIHLNWDLPDTTDHFLLRLTFNDDSGTTVSGNISSTTTSLSFENLEDGRYLYSLYALDAFGNMSSEGTSSELIIDTLAPNAPTISAEKNAPDGSSIVLSWDATGENNHFKLTRTFNDDDETVISANMVASSTGLTQTGLADGVYTYHLYLIDNFSNSSTAGTSNALTIDTLAPNAPTISAEKNAPDGSSIVLSWDATDDDNHFKLTRTFNDDDETVISANMVSSSTGLTQTGLADGVYTYHLYLIDNFSNSSTAGTSNALIIDTTATSPVTALTLVASANLSISLHWTNPSASDFASITIRRSETTYPDTISSGDTVTSNLTVSNYHDSGLLSGTYYYSVFALDTLGNISHPATGSATILVNEAEFNNRSEFDRGDLIISTPTDNIIQNPVIGSQGNASVTLNTALKSNSLVLGDFTEATTTLYLTTVDSQLKDSGNVVVGNKGTGKIIQSNGLVDIDGTLTLGSSLGGNGEYHLSGGELICDTLNTGTTSTANRFTWTGGQLSPNSVAGNLVNHGGDLIIKSGTPVTISGDYHQSSTSKTRFLLQHRDTPAFSSLQAQTSSSTALLHVTGTLEFSGTVSVTLDGYTPRPGDQIQLLNGVAINSVLHSNDITFDLPTLTNGMSWNTSQFVSDGILSINGSSNGLVSGKPLNYPNPFTLSQGTDIVYFLNEASDIELRVYSAWGQEVYRDHYSNNAEGSKAGTNTIQLNRNLTGSTWPSGVYFYLLIKDGKPVAKGKLAVSPE